MSSEVIRQLKKTAASLGLRIVQCNEHHFQIIGGPLLVNYYPHSKASSAYVAGTRSAKKYVTPQEACAMTSAAPAVSQPTKKRPQLTQHKRRLMKKGYNCHWCGQRCFDPAIDGPCEPGLEATVDHRIPRSRGGLDHSNNYVLAHAKCNTDRGNDMPELAK